MTGRHRTRRELLRATTVVGGAVALTGFGANTSLTPKARAAAEPRVYTREEWQARPPSEPVTVMQGPPDRIIVHHTASDNVPDTSLEQAYALSHWIQDLHMDDNDWIDAGQQLTISRGGYVLEGRDRSLEAIRAGTFVYGTHVAGENGHTIGIENEGLYTSEDPPAALFDSLVQTCAWLCEVYGLEPHASIVGHRDYNNTQCPGDMLYARLPELRDRVADALG